jgi:hypothetical protein
VALTVLANGTRRHNARATASTPPVTIRLDREGTARTRSNKITSRVDANRNRYGTTGKRVLSFLTVMRLMNVK